MARFDLYAPRGGGGYIVDVQSNVLARLNTRVGIPLLPRPDDEPVMAGLNPIFLIEGAEYVLATQFLAAYRQADLGRLVGSLADRRDAITQALDRLLFEY